MNAKKVFIVDDALDYRTLLSVAFKQAGYKVYLAKDGIEAYKKFFKVKPDIILVDILLPRMRGDTLIRWLKGTSLGKETPVIVISGHAAMKEYLYQIGIELFFEKPCKTADVLEVAREVLEIYENKKILNARIENLKEKYQKPGQKKQQTKEKICEACKMTMPATAMRCENCGSMRLRILD